jgi:copper(I)-binding protein
MYRWSLSLAALLCAASLAAASPKVTVSDAWIRLLPGTLPLAGYFEATNPGTAPVRLTGAASDAFGRVMMHETLEQNGVSKMVPVTSVEIPPNATVRFEPGGYHLMLMGRKRDLKVGERIPVTLEFADGGTVSVDFAVKGASGQ